MRNESKNTEQEQRTSPSSPEAAGWQQDWERCTAFHGHSCPGLAIGFQAARAAQTILGLGPSPDEEVVCVTENDACGVDAIQVLTSCTLGKGNLIYRPQGKQAFSFFCRGSGRQVRLVLRPLEWPEDREEKRQAMLQMDPTALFEQKQPDFELPEKARRFLTIFCEQCGEGTAEPYVRLQEGRQLCTSCSEAYTRGW